MAGNYSNEACRHAARSRRSRRLVFSGGSWSDAFSRSQLLGLFLISVSLSICLCAFAATLPAPAVFAATKVEQGQFCSEVGGLGGQCSSSTGVAINRAGLGGVTVSDVYVTDKGNNRVQEFTAEGAFVRAFGTNVVRTGPDNNSAVNEVQIVTIKGTSGTFKLNLTFNGSTQTTGAINYNAGAAEVEAALQALSNVGAIGGTIIVGGGPGDATGSTPYTLAFGGALAGTDIPQVTIDASGIGVAEGAALTCAGGPTGGTGATAVVYQWLAGGAPAAGPGATTSAYSIVAADAGKVIQCQVIATHAAGTAKTAAIQVSNPAVVASPSPGAPPVAPGSIAAPAVVGGGNLTAAGKKLTCAAGSWTGVTLPFSFQWYRNGVALSGNGANTSEYTVQAADVAAAANFQCSVTGSNPVGPVIKVSANRITAAPLPAPNPTAPVATATLTAPTSSTGTTTNGVDAAEVCVAVNGDICQAGLASSIAGSVNAPESVAIDQANGNIYVASGGNTRVDIFTPKGAFEGAFGWKVNKTAPEANLQFCTSLTGCQASEGSPMAGGLSSLSHSALAVDSNGHVYVGERGNLRVNEFIPVLNGGKEVTSVAFARAIGGDVISGGAEGKGTLTSGSNEITEIKTTSRAFVAGQSISGEGIPAGTTITAVRISFLTFENKLVLSKPVEATGVKTLTSAAGSGNVPRNEKQTITVTATGGNFKLNFGTTLPSEELITPANIPWNASAAEVETALKSLNNISSATIGTENVAVAGPAGGPYTVEFKGSRFADTNVAQLVIAAGSPNLTGGTATVSTTVEGTSGEICTTATGCQAGSGGAPFDTCNGSGCRASTAGGAAGFFPSNTPVGLAVDSSGFVYAVTAEGTCSSTIPCRVQKFNPDGTFKESFGPASGGDAECQLTWTTGAANVEAAIGIAVDPANQHVFVARKMTENTMKICEFDSAGVLKDISPASAVTTAAGGYQGLALSSTEHVYLNTPSLTPQGSIYILGPAPATEKPEILVPEEITSTNAKLRGKVLVPLPGGPGFNTLYHFEYSADNGLNWTSVPIPDSSVGSTSGTYPVNRTITGLQPNLTYKYRLVATTGPSVTSAEEHFTTLGAKPTITSTQALPITGATAKLTSLVNPNNSPTTYHFEWGFDASYGHQVPDFEAFTGSGGLPVSIGANISGLQLSTTYHFRIVATNMTGTTVGPDVSFKTTNFPTTCANEAIRSVQGSQNLPDCRAYEQVSPNDKRPVGAVRTFFSTQLNYQASTNGNRVQYPILNGLPNATAGGELEYLASRTGESWLSTQLSSPALVHSRPAGENNTGRIIYNSTDLSCTILESAQPLTTDSPEIDIENGVSNLYRRDASGTYTLLTAAIPHNTPLKEANRYAVAWASDDCTHVLFDTEYRFLFGGPLSGRVLYEWSNGLLHFAGVRPDGSVAAGAEAGGGDSELEGTAINSMSQDGSRIFFTATSNQGVDSGGTAIFVRENGTTTNISKAGALSGVEFDGATPDGSHVYFLAKYGLTSSSSKGPVSCILGQPGTSPTGGEGCDLYDYDVDHSTLTDLSADTNAADLKGAGVIGLIDSSEDGSFVYFAARGQLIPGLGNTQTQNLAGTGAYNIYLSHNGQLSYVGVMAGAETNKLGGGSNLASAFEYWSADATPDGSYLLFLSKANVTGYNSGGVSEAYRYSVASDSVVCITCRPDGLPSVGTEQTSPITYKKSPEWSTTSILRYRPRAISTDGTRIMFTMPDVLVPGAVSGSRNLYEWESGKVYLLIAGNGEAGSSEVLYADSSASGDDIFFRTKASLVPQDFDQTTDLYDAKIGGGYQYSSPTSSCEVLSGKCQAQSQPAPNSTLDDDNFSGPSNPSVPKHKKRHTHRGGKHHGRSHRHPTGRDRGNHGRIR